MLRVRFTSPDEDYRPVTWPVTHPYWCTGYVDSNDHAIVVAYVDRLDDIEPLWPGAYDITSEEADHYVFSSRFPSAGVVYQLTAEPPRQ